MVNAKSSKVSPVYKKESLKHTNRETTKNNQASAKSSVNNVLLENTPTIRQQLLEQLRPLLPEHELSPLLLALSFGERSQISPDLWEVLQTTGTQHLIAISGLHLGLVASSVLIFIFFLIRIVPVTRFTSGTVQQKLLKITKNY
ncbi:MAG: ComEC/Rec2 family competence protein [Alteromonadaceae bacterium]|nr:ComEC/Rec2 family competence protein [Alteromonadaceae bacterium]